MNVYFYKFVDGVFLITKQDQKLEIVFRMFGMDIHPEIFAFFGEL